MAAPKGNQFWKYRNKHGRGKLFADPVGLWVGACGYFEWCEKHPLYKTELVTKDTGVIRVRVPWPRPYTVSGLCARLRCSRAYFYKCAAVADSGNYPESEEDFFYTVTRVRDIIHVQNFEGAMMGFFNPALTSRMLRLTDGNGG